MDFDTVILVTGKADGPTSVFLAGRLGIAVLIEKSSVFHYNELYVTVWQSWTVVYSRQMKSVVSIAPAAAAKRHISLCGCVHNFILSGQFFDRQYNYIYAAGETMRHSCQKEKRRRECMCHFGDDDIVIGHIRLKPVHVFPPIWLTDMEMDFYMDDGDDIYLLTIRNNDKRILTVLYTRKEIRDIVMELPTQGIDRQHLQGIIRALRSVPYAQKLRLGEQKRYALK